MNLDLTRVGHVMQSIRDRIDRRVLTPGARLPSVRAMAEATGFSKSTVVEAYDRLAADGAIRSRPGSGFYVSAPLSPLSLDRIGTPIEREVDPLWMLRQSLAEPSVFLRIGRENAAPEFRTLSIVGANYGLARRNLGAVSVIGPIRMDYPRAIIAVRQAANELSRFVAEVYDE